MPNIAKPRSKATTEKTKSHGRDYLLAALALVAEGAGAVFGIRALGYFAVLFFFLAFWDSTKESLHAVSRLKRWSTLALTMAMMCVVMHYIMIRVQALEIAREGIVKLQFSINQDRTLILDNSLGKSELVDFHINALEVWLDDVAFDKGDAKIKDSTQIGNDLNDTPFMLKAGEIKDISLLTPEYAILEYNSQPTNQLQPLARTHYYCLRFLFLNAATGETFVHYMVISAYRGPLGLLLAVGEHPETETHDDKNAATGFPFNIARAIKEHARNHWGTEYREYQP